MFDKVKFDEIVFDGSGSVPPVPTDVNKTLDYLVVTEIDTEKTLAYEVVAPVDIEKALAYTVIATPADIEKGLEYQIKYQTDINKGLDYEVQGPIDINKGLEYRVITTPAESTKGLEYIVNPPPPQEISSGRVVVASDTTVATGVEDIDGLTFDITLKNTGYIMAFMSLTSEVDTSLKKGYFSINIDGVDSPIIERRHTLKNKDGSVGVTYRSGLLAAGTYTVKGRHYTDAGTILTSKNITLVAFPTEDEGGNPIRSVYDTVATDSVTGDTIEDIDGLTQDLTTVGLSFVFQMIVGSVSASAASIYRLILCMNGKDVEVDRSITSADDVGSVGLVGRTETPMDAETITLKGEHASEAGITGIIAPSILVGLDLSTISGGVGYVIPSGNIFIQGATISTTSTTLEDMPGADTEVILTQEAHIFAVITLEAESVKALKENYFALNINGVDFEETQRSSNDKLDKAVITIVARTTSKLAAGTYTVKGRWRTTVGNTLRAINDLSLVAIGLETTTQDLPTHIHRSLDYKVVSQVDVTKGLEYQVISTPSEITKGLDYFISLTFDITKGLEYQIVAPTDITKGLDYQVKEPTYIEKGLQYAVISPTDKTLNLKYTVLTTPTQIDKTLDYEVIIPADITKTLDYLVKTSSSITRTLEYQIITTPAEKTKGLEYEVITPAEITKGLEYVIVAQVDITKGLGYEIIQTFDNTLALRYEILSEISITKGLEYIISNKIEITKSLDYEVITPAEITKGLEYQIITGVDLTRTLEYTVITQAEKTKALDYRIIQTFDNTLGLQYIVTAQIGITKNLKYVIIGQEEITKGLEYQLKFYPYSTKDSPYSTKDSPYEPFPRE